MRVGPTILVGSADPWAARMAITVLGMSVTPAVLKAKKVHMASLASSPWGWSERISFIARSPRGVAALPSPNMFALRAIKMDPIAG